VSTEENIQAQLAALLEQGSLPRSACSGSFLKALRPLLESGVILEERCGAGRRLAVGNAVALRQFFTGRYPGVTAFEGASNRIVGVARFRDSKTVPGSPVELVCVRAWKAGALCRGGQVVEVALATQEHGVFAFLLGNESPYSLHGPCALVENPAVFTCIERLDLAIGLAVYGHGRASNRLLEWLAGMSAPDFVLMHLPDYDPVGLSEFTRLRERLGRRVRLHLPADLPARFERFSNRALLGKPNSRGLLTSLRHSPGPEVHQVLELIHRYNAGLEQEALLLDINAK
jgi:hypothetical protein